MKMNAIFMNWRESPRRDGKPGVTKSVVVVDADEGDSYTCYVSDYERDQFPLMAEPAEIPVSIRLDEFRGKYSIRLTILEPPKLKGAKSGPSAAPSATGGAAVFPNQKTA